MVESHANQLHDLDISDAGFFVLRSPTLPAEDFLKWTNNASLSQLLHATSCPSELDNAWRRDVGILRDRLRSIIDRPEIGRALLVASPALQSGIQHWKSDPDSKKGLQAERTLVRYFTRMCTRPTPFGLFAGCTLGRISKSSTDIGSLNLPPRRTYLTVMTQL